MAALFKYLTGSGQKPPSTRVEGNEQSSSDPGSEDSFDSDAAERDSVYGEEIRGETASAKRKRFLKRRAHDRHKEVKLYPQI